MRTYSSASVNVGDEPEDVPVIKDFQGASVIKFSSEFLVWYHAGRNRVAGLTALRGAITAHLKEIDPTGEAKTKIEIAQKIAYAAFYAGFDAGCAEPDAPPAPARFGVIDHAWNKYWHAVLFGGLRSDMADALAYGISAIAASPAGIAKAAADMMAPIVKAAFPEPKS